MCDSARQACDPQRNSVTHYSSRNVFNCFLNCLTVSDCFNPAGRLFQTFGPATEKALEAISVLSRTRQ